MIFYRFIYRGWSAVLLAMLLAIPADLFSATNAEGEKVDSLHAQPWAFGHSQTRDDKIWEKGLCGDEVSRKKKYKPSTQATPQESLSEAEKANVKSSLGMSMRNEAGTWKVAPEEKLLHPDENMYRDRRHVVRAFADVKAGDNLDISLGPELILKDEHHGEETATESQPDSELGVGMRFKYGF